MTYNFQQYKTIDILVIIFIQVKLIFIFYNKSIPRKYKSRLMKVHMLFMKVES